jgi:hypothetical protein
MDSSLKKFKEPCNTGLDFEQRRWQRNNYDGRPPEEVQTSIYLPTITSAVV